MKLTTEQIAQIEETLILNGLIYEDLKLEITDHIASEIEEIMNREDISFDIVYKSVFEKWENALAISSSSTWLGVFFKAPKFVIDKFVTYSKRQLIKISISALTFGFVLVFILSNTSGKQTFEAINLALKGTYIILTVCTIISMFLIWRSAIKTIYGRMFIQRGYVVFIFLFQVHILNEPIIFFNIRNSFWLNVLGCFLLCWTFTYSFFQLIMAMEHFRIVKKLKLV